MRLDVLGALLGQGVACVQQIIDGRLDDVERVAQLVSDASGNLTDGRQALAALQADDVFRLVGVLDEGQVEIDQRVERAPARAQLLGRRGQRSSSWRIKPRRSRDRATLVNT